jgi:hypothetical protein
MPRGMSRLGIEHLSGLGIGIVVVVGTSAGVGRWWPLCLMHGCHDWVLWLCFAVLSLAASKEEEYYQSHDRNHSHASNCTTYMAPIGADNDDAGTGVGVRVGFGEGLGVGEGMGDVLVGGGDEYWLNEVKVVRAVGGELYALKAEIFGTLALVGNRSP